jgi:hypothetical protein
MRVDEIAAPLAHDARQRERATQHRDGIEARDVEPNELGAAAATSSSSRPPFDTTIDAMSVAARMRIRSIAPASAAPACSVGTTISAVSGRENATTSPAAGLRDACSMESAPGSSGNRAVAREFTRSTSCPRASRFTPNRPAA